jgi:hypothetical protein
LKHLGIHEEIKSRLNMGNACYHAVQNVLSSYLLLKNIKVKIYKTTVLPATFLWVQTFCFHVKGSSYLGVWQSGSSKVYVEEGACFTGM